jgi:hypothetical protein
MEGLPEGSRIVSTHLPRPGSVMMQTHHAGSRGVNDTAFE